MAAELNAGIPSDALRRIPVGIAVIEKPGRILWANPAYFETTGRDPAMVGMDFHEILEEDGSWSAPVRAAVDKVLGGHEPIAFAAVRSRHRQQEGGVFLDIDIVPLAGAPEAPARALLMIRDVTGRVRDHERARLFHESFRTSTNAMQLTDANGVMINVNPAFERIYGYSREECVGRKPNLVRSRHTSPEVYTQLWADLKDPSRGYWSGELTNRDRRGRERPVLLSITAIRDEDGLTTHYIGVAVDLSEQRSWELRAAHADKLASIGQLAAGVAHEMNTPLGNVMLISESMRQQTTDPKLLARLDKLADQVDAAARIVRGLLDFARRDDPHEDDLDFAELVGDSIAFLRGKQSVDLVIEERSQVGPVPIRGDRGQLMQVVANILNNASDAMHGSGTIQVAVRRHGRSAELEVVDSGPGISPDAIPRIFEPFFTTKPEGEGTGLGLAICHGIVRSHHGTISARNVLGAGAAFLITLPIREDATADGPA